MENAGQSLQLLCTGCCGSTLILFVTVFALNKSGRFQKSRGLKFFAQLVQFVLSLLVVVGVAVFLLREAGVYEPSTLVTVLILAVIVSYVGTNPLEEFTETMRDYADLRTSNPTRRSTRTLTPVAPPPVADK